MELDFRQVVPHVLIESEDALVARAWPIFEYRGVRMLKRVADFFLLDDDHVLIDVVGLESHVNFVVICFLRLLGEQARAFASG